ncbi:MAG TPA: MFS transporter [Myxococcota bacterium]|nr:MFS transporter [Myxococcota bacterium]HRY94566.1 MFS transporter [Myxococcota bacterium]HSA20168.1 MFS transporter [Myxococcota bacterium]
MPWRALVRWFATGAERPRLQDPARLARRYAQLRWQTFCGVTLGYAFFYTTRLSLVVAKKPLIDAGVVSAGELGTMGSALLLMYAVGKLGSGFLADRAHVGRFMAAGLLGSAVVNLLFGCTESVPFFTLLWAVNGWFQSMGATPSVVNLSHWFSPRERGTRYSIWSIAHSLGEGITYSATAALVAWLGWRWGFFGPGIACALVSVVLARVVLDRPQTHGLPPIAEFKADLPAPEAGAPSSVAELQRQVVRNPRVWMLGLASAAFYVTRYGVNSWFVLYLQEAKTYSLVEAGFGMTLLTACGLAGTVLAGTISDLVFGARRGPVLFSYGALLVGSLFGLYVTPAGQHLLDGLALGVCGFATGGLLVFFGGLLVVDICPTRATGAAMGMIGVFAYLGAAAQDTVSGQLIESTRRVVDGAVTHSYDSAFCLWIAAAVVSLVLAFAALAVRRPGSGLPDRGVSGMETAP